MSIMGPNNQYSYEQNSADNLFLFGHLRITYFHLYPRAGRFFHQSARDAQFLQGVLVNLGVTWRPRSSDFFQKSHQQQKLSGQ